MYVGGWFDVLFNNVGIGIGGLLEVMSLNDVECVIDINLKGMFWGVQVGFGYLKNMSGFVLVSMLLVVGIYVSVGMLVYFVIKFGVCVMIELFDCEWVQVGVKVWMIMLSFIDMFLFDVIVFGLNQVICDVVCDVGLEFMFVEQVVQVVWDVVYGGKVYILVGKIVCCLKFVVIWVLWLLLKWFLLNDQVFCIVFLFEFVFRGL